MNCLACGGERLGSDFSVGDFQVLRCPDCGLGLTAPPVPPAEIDRWYPEAYYGKENVRFNALFELLTRWFRRRRASVLRRRVPPGAVLDVGCGRGLMLEGLRKLGYAACGAELNEAAAWHARNRLGLDVRTGGFLDYPLEEGRFEAVVFWHTLEHFPDPDAAVGRARRLLKPGGLLAVALPNSESLQARLFGRHWFHLDVPRHYTHFGTRALEALLERHSFRVVQRDHFSLEQNPYGWLQSLYNALGFPENLLYDLLKAPSARSGTARAHPLACALSLLLLPLLLGLALLMTVIEAALRRGGTVEVYAVKL